MTPDLSRIHPLLAQALAPHVDATQFWSDLCSQEAQRRANRLHPYIVVCGNRKSPRVRLEVMAESRARAQEQHEHLARIGERCEVLTPDEERRLGSKP